MAYEAAIWWHFIPVELTKMRISRMSDVRYKHFETLGILPLAHGLPRCDLVTLSESGHFPSYWVCVSEFRMLTL